MVTFIYSKYQKIFVADVINLYPGPTTRPLIVYILPSQTPRVKIRLWHLDISSFKSSIFSLIQKHPKNSAAHIPDKTH